MSSPKNITRKDLNAFAPNQRVILTIEQLIKQTNALLTAIQNQAFGSFKKTSSQSPSAPNVENILTFDSAENNAGLSIGTPTSRIVAAYAGIYTLSASVQLLSTSVAAKDVWVWFKKNGAAIPESARVGILEKNDERSILVEYGIVSLSAGDYIELAFASSDIAMSVSTFAATSFAPASPAVILNITQAQL